MTTTTTMIPSDAFPHPGTVVKEIWTDWDRLMFDIGEMQADQPFWIPTSHFIHDMIPAVVGTALICTIVYMFSYYIVVDRIFPKQDMTTTLRKSRAACQITNMVFNTIIGGLGLYYEYYVLPTLPAYSNTNMMTTDASSSPSNNLHLDRIPGHEEYFYLMSAMQFGYQMWAFPIGLFFIKEPIEMMIHHVAVIFATTASGFTTFGFRYYSPYFYGIMELSSVPLAIMNAFKDNPTLLKRHPVGYLVARAVFSFGFLYVRIYMWYFRGPIFLRDLFFVSYTKPCNWIGRIFMMSQWSLCMVLGVLIHWWAYLVLKGQYGWFKKFFITLFRNLRLKLSTSDKPKKI